MSSSLLLLVIAAASLVSCCVGSRVNLVIPAKANDCLYLRKGTGERLNIVLQVLRGAQTVAFTLISPRNDVIKHTYDMKEMVLDETVHLPGDYRLCFHNDRAMSRETVVGVEYDAHMEHSDDSRLEKRIHEEKMRLVENIVEQRKATVVRPGHQEEFLASQAEPVDSRKMIMDIIPEESFEAAKTRLLLISLRVDQMTTSLNMFKYKRSLHFYLQSENLSYVSRYSFFLCLCIMISGFTQVVVLKSFFNGYLSWKVWKF